ncbi:MAG: radical SAM protein, partial [Candidatus Omnitrophota bacterium]
MSIKPLGLARIGANLKVHNIYTSYHDANSKGLSEETLADQLAELSKRLHGPLIIGISVLSGNDKYLEKFLQDVRQKTSGRNDVYIVAGGYEPTMTAASFMEKFPEIDLIIKAEGEVAMVNLVKAISGKSDLSEVDNLVYRDAQGKVIENKNCRVLSEEELSKLPPPDFSGLVDAEDLFRRKVLLDTSKGCPGACIFCGLHDFFGESKSLGVRNRETRTKDLWWRGRDPVTVVDEIEKLYTEYGFTGFDLVDDDFIGSDPERARMIAEEIIKRELDIGFWFLTRTDSVVNAGEETFKLLRKAGAKMVFLGVESFDSKQLKFMRKLTTPAVNKKAVKILQRAGIKVVRIGFINFYKDSTLSQIRTNINWVKQLNLEASIPTPSHRLMVYDNTRLLYKYQKQGVPLKTTDRGHFEYEFTDDRVAFLYRVTKEIADRSYPLMKHFRELQEQEYYSPSGLSSEASKVYNDLKKIEFEFFEETLRLVETKELSALTEDLPSIQDLSDEYYEKMIDRIKKFNKWTVENGFEAECVLPDLKLFPHPIERVYALLKEKGNAWIALGDFRKLWDRNNVYGREFMDIFIEKVSGIADSVCKKYNGFAAHLVGDQIIIVLPDNYSSEEAAKIYGQIHNAIYKNFYDQYGFAHLDIPAETEEAVVTKLQHLPSILGVNKINMFENKERTIVAEKHCILFSTDGMTDKDKLDSILKHFKGTVSGSIDFEVMVPWIPIGAAKAEYTTRDDGDTIKTWTAKILEEADFMQHIAKEETADMIAVSDNITSLFRKTKRAVTPEEKGLFSPEERETIENETTETIRLLRTTKRKTEEQYPCFKMGALRSILEQSMFHSGGNEALLAKVKVGYTVTDKKLLPSFQHGSSTRDLRKDENGDVIFGFKSIMSHYGHTMGDDLILLIARQMDELFRQNTNYRVNIVRSPPEQFYLVFERTGKGLPGTNDILKSMESLM